VQLRVIKRIEPVPNTNPLNGSVLYGPGTVSRVILGFKTCKCHLGNISQRQTRVRFTQPIAGNRLQRAGVNQMIGQLKSGIRFFLLWVSSCKQQHCTELEIASNESLSIILFTWLSGFGLVDYVQCGVGDAMSIFAYAACVNWPMQHTAHHVTAPCVLYQLILLLLVEGLNS
jgi:hypothetical protein